MNFDELLEAIEQVLLLRQLNPVERLILRQSWFGQTYNDMAKDSAYCSSHIKEIGSRLWQDLSEALGERVTKKNLHLVWNQYQKNQTDKLAKTPPQLQSNPQAKDDFPNLLTKTPVKFPSGPVPLDSPLYINRPPIEELACAEINQPGCVIRIKAPRKMGKTSLLNRIIAYGNEQGYKTVSLDFQEADTAIFTSLDKFLRWFCVNISKQLDLNPMLDDYWDEDMGSKVSCKMYFQDYLLEQIDRPLVLGLNEVNRVFEYPNIAQDFLPMLRLWHEQARTVEAWQKLRLVVVHATEIYVPLKINQSPFNIGLPICLSQFSQEQVQDLAERYGLNWTDGSCTQKLMAMVGGHPYLVNVALYHLSRGQMKLEELLQGAPTMGGIYGHHLRGLLDMLQQDTRLATALQQVVTARGSVQLEAIAAYKLESMGLVQLDGNLAKPSCQLYRLYFKKQLFSENQSIASDRAMDNTAFGQQVDPENQNLLHLNAIDKATLLANRIYFNNYLEREWKRSVRSRTPLSLILCNIDFFKEYKDTYGDTAANDCLRQVGRAINSCVMRPADLVARYDSEEFALILPDTENGGAIHVAEKIRETVKSLAILHSTSSLHPPIITISVGIASTTPTSESDLYHIIDAAEQALHLSQSLGRDRVTLRKI